MNWDAVGAIAELAGVTAVVITLFYLAIQVRLNALQQRSENLRALSEESNRIISIMYEREMTGSIVRALADWDSASANDQNITSVFLLQYCQFVQNVFWMFESKAIDKSMYAPSRSMWLVTLANPGGRVWWESFSGVFDKRFVEQVDARLRTGRITGTTETIPFWDLAHWRAE